MQEEKIYSSFKLFWHPEKIDALRRGELTAPIYVRVKPTNKCNHRCFYCSYQLDYQHVRHTFNPKDIIPTEKLHEILQDFKDMGVKAVTYSGGGEPLLHPDIEDVLEKTLAYGIDLSIITNGQFLKGRTAEILSRAEWVRISLDSATPEVFQDTRGVPAKAFHDICENIRQFASMKKSDCELGVNFVIQEKNHDQVYHAVKVFRDLGADHIKLTARNLPTFHEYHAPYKDRVMEQIARSREDLLSDTFRIHCTYESDFTVACIYEREYEQCRMMEVVSVIAADCKVYHCHDKAYHETDFVGSLKNQSFRQLWSDPRTRECFHNFNAKKKCDHHCTYDLRNTFLNRFLSTKRRHCNFI